MIKEVIFSDLSNADELIKKYLTSDHSNLGELGHQTSTVINLQNVSHKIVDCYMTGDKSFVNIEILDTISGEILNEIIKNEIPVNIEPRVFGDKIISFDVIT